MADAEAITVQTQWSIDPGAVPAPINQFLIQQGGGVADGLHSGEYYLTFGHALPPLLPPGFTPPPVGVTIPVATLGQFAVSWERLREFSTILSKYIADMEPQIEAERRS